MSKALLEIIGAALSYAPTSCRYHGTDWNFLGRELDGSPRCDSCKHPYRALLALHALDQLTDVVVDVAIAQRAGG